MPYQLNTLRSKIIVLSCVIAAVAALVVTFVASQLLLTASRNGVEAELRVESKFVARRFQDRFDDLHRDVTTVAGFPPVAGIMRSVRQSKTNPASDSDLDVWRDRLEVIFESVLRERPIYTQMRFIGVGDGGRELVRVNRTESGLQKVAPQYLQAKGRETYFRRGLSLAPEEIAFSDISFNREYGGIDTSMTLTIRVLKSVYENGALFGFIVINADYQQLILSIIDELDPVHSLYMINHRGDVAFHDVERDISSFYDRTNTNIPDFEQISSLIERDKRETQELLDGVVFYLFDLYSETDVYIKAVARIDYQSLYQGFFDFRDRIILLNFLIFLILVSASYFVASYLTRPLKVMTKTLEEAAGQGHLPDLPLNRNDEFGALSRAFYRLLRKINETQRFLTLVMDVIPNYILVKNRESIIIQANKSFLQLYPEDARQKVIGSTTAEQFAKEERETFLEMDRAAFDKGYSEIDQHLHFPNGDEKILHTQKIKFVNEDGEELILVVAADVTVQQRLIQDLRESNKLLDDFAYHASHDLKAPLRVISNAASWLEEDLEPVLDEESRSNIELLLNRSKRMEKLLDDLLAYSRIGRSEGGKYSQMTTGEEVKENLNALAALPGNFTLKFCDGFEKIRMPVMPLQQVLLNLVGNAIKHHDRTDGTIEIAVEDEGRFYRFSVRDDGPGIPDEYHERIFEMFKTLKPRDVVEGSGMGLAIVKKQIEVRGGEITVTSRAGEGCVFQFTLPKENAAVMSPRTGPTG